MSVESDKLILNFLWESKKKTKTKESQNDYEKEQSWRTHTI